MGCGGSKPAAEPASAPGPAPDAPTAAAASTTPACASTSVPAASPAAAAGSGGVDAAEVSASGKPKVLIAFYSLYGHVQTLAGALKEGLEAGGVDVDIKRVHETLPDEVLEKMHAPPKSEDIGVLDIDTLPQYDGIVFGSGTRFGMLTSQLKAAFDATGGHWQKGALRGKTAGIFFSTGTQGGGQETTALTAVTQFTHHGMLYVPHGYGSPSIQFDNSVAHGGSPYGPGTLAGPKGDQQPTEGELGMAKDYGTHFATITKALTVGKAMLA